MAQVDALKVVNDVRRRLVDLALSQNYVRQPTLVNIFRDICEGSGDKGGLVSDLWVEGAFPAEESAETLKILSGKGVFPADLCNLLDQKDKFPKDRKLYTHQAEALRVFEDGQEKDRPGLVIQAGTGAGKTEAFLLPILRDLWRHHKRSQNGGMRCLILYPMNALIADQVERIYAWLQGQSRVTVFHFNSETPEDERQANQRGVPKYEACRKRTRNEARESVPDIVITNYSMLEYMLCRPQDNGFFGSDFRAVVLDEAHLYSGNLAAEVALLLRRVRNRCEVSPSQLMQILSSATLGGTQNDLCRFAAQMFSINADDVRAIQGKKASCRLAAMTAAPVSPANSGTLAQYSQLDITTLNATEEFVPGDKKVMAALEKIAVQLADKNTVDAARNRYSETPAPFLHTILEKAPIIHILAANLYERGIISLPDLSKILWGNKEINDTRATTLLLRLAAAARYASCSSSASLSHSGA